MHLVILAFHGRHLPVAFSGASLSDVASQVTNAIAATATAYKLFIQTNLEEYLARQNTPYGRSSASWGHWNISYQPEATADPAVLSAAFGDAFPPFPGLRYPNATPDSVPAVVLAA